MKVEFSTTEYEWAHGHAPRGRGWWCFEARGQEFWAEGLMTLSEAKRIARDHFKSIMQEDGAATISIRVMP